MCLDQEHSLLEIERLHILFYSIQIGRDWERPVLSYNRCRLLLLILLLCTKFNYPQNGETRNVRGTLINFEGELVLIFTYLNSFQKYYIFMIFFNSVSFHIDF